MGFGRWKKPPTLILSVTYREEGRLLLGKGGHGREGDLHGADDVAP